MKALAKSTEYKYDKALSNYLATGNDLTNYAALQQYAETISNSAKAHLKAAIERYTEKALIQMKAQATLDNVDLIQVAGYRAEALSKAITVKQPKGSKIHSWLTKDEVTQLMELTNGNDIVSQRDKLVLALLIHAGLRRDELVNLTDKDIIKLDDTYVLNIKGKGDKFRIIPISTELYNLLADKTGYIIRPLGMNKEVKDGPITGQSILNIVSKYGQMIDKPHLRPHDLRRTFAEFLRKQGLDIVEISTLLGHESVETTKRYLNIKVNLSHIPGNFIPL